jgi:surface antigen
MTAYHSTRSDYDYDDGHDFDGMQPGDRIGRPLPSVRLRTLRRLAVVAVVLGAGAGLYRADIDWVAMRDSIAALLPAKPTPAEPTPAPAAPPPPPIEAAAERAIAPPPAALAEPQPETAKPPEGADVAARSPEPGTDLVAAAPAPPERLPPPAVDRADPLQVKAAAAGLHPELSRVLLASLTAADYRNARAAIDKALAETPEGGTLEWPRKPGAGQAVFAVHFVAGAPDSCRRYVVIVTKDSWSTTAMPLERCGQKSAVRR